MQPGAPAAPEPAARPALRAGTPDPTHLDEPATRVPRPPTERRSRARRPPRDPADGPTLTRMFGQFGIFGLAILAIIVLLLLPCVIGIEFLAHR